MRKWSPKELEEVSCDFCGSLDVLKEFTRTDGMHVVECARCGLAFLNPRPKREFIPRFYDADYFTGAAVDRGDGGLKCNLDTTALVQETNTRPLEVVKQKFGGWEGKDVLEIGCATGDLLVHLQKAGARVRGLEISDFASDIARRRGLEVTTGILEDLVQNIEQQFDVVIGLEVIEHVLSPLRFFKNISHILKPGGTLVLSTPNYACTRMAGSDWLGFRMSFEHLYFFSIRVLQQMAFETGFSLQYIETSKQIGELPHENPTFITTQIVRAKILQYFVREIGVRGTIAAVIQKRRGRYLYPLGHAMLALFQNTGA
jgi:SAM-dependent methyltransferase